MTDKGRLKQIEQDIKKLEDIAARNPLAGLLGTHVLEDLRFERAQTILWLEEGCRESV